MSSCSYYPNRHSSAGPRRHANYWRWAAFALVVLLSLSSWRQRALAQPVELAPTMEQLPPVLARPADAPPLLTLEDLEQIALQSNPSLGRAAALVGAARGNWVQAGLPPNPSVGYEGQQLGSGGRAEQHGVLFSQEWVRRDKLRLSREVGSWEINRAQQQFNAQQRRVLTDVRIAFYQVLLAQRQMDLATELVRIGERGVQAAETLLKALEGNRVDVLQARVELENARILAENARNRLDAAWASLTAVVGRPLSCQPLAGDAYAPPQEFDFCETLARLQSVSPEIAIAVANVERARAALARARVEPLPNLTVEGLVNWQDNGIGGRPDGGVAVTVPVPLWDRNQGAIRQAQSELAAAQQAVAQLELSLQQRLAPVYERYRNARNQVERYRTAILPAAEETLSLTRELYDVGQTNFVALLVAQRTYSQTNVAYLDALRELRVAEAEIEGLLLTGSLSTP